jgi:D-threonate/D-erythronate kinase
LTTTDTPAPAEHGRLVMAVLADDLTGALASGARLRQRGLDARVRWRLGDPGRLTDAVAVDLRTRDSRRAPRERARRWASDLAGAGCRRFELRVDSTMRGVAGQELAGLLAGLGLDDPWVLAVPAFPAAGRVTVGGRQHVLGMGGRRVLGEVAPWLFGPRPATLLGLEVLEQGAAAVTATMRRAAARGECRFVADATGDDHLRVAAGAAALLEREGISLVTASPGAWLAWYPELPCQAEPYGLVVLSSPSVENRSQLALLRRCRPTLVLGAGEVLRGEAWREQAAAAATIVVQTIEGEVPWVGHNEQQAGQAAAAARRVLEAEPRPCLGVVVSGGHTLACFVDLLGAQELRVDAELEPLCSRSTVQDGPWAGLTLIGKGGQIGGDATLSALVDTLWRNRP